MKLKCRDRLLELPDRPLVMGIVNINDDSFSGDGTLDPKEALNHARSLVEEGADIIDVGAESARTNREAIPVEEEIGRLLPFLEAYRSSVVEEARTEQDRRPASDRVWPPLLSINTWRPEVARGVLPHGGDVLNDMGGLPDDRNARICAEWGVSLLIMHSVGEPKIPHTTQQYPDILRTLDQFFDDKLSLAGAAGLSAEQTILDPGIDFAKQKDDNLRILGNLERLQRWGRPVLVPVSRKTVIGEVLGIPSAADRDAGTLACVTASFLRGAQIVRVHDVRIAVESLRVLAAVRDGKIGASSR